MRAHRELMIEPDRGSGPADGAIAVGTVDFARFLRRMVSLPRNSPTTLPISSNGAGDVIDATGRSRRRPRPRLLIVARRGTRRVLNADAVARVVEEVGFDVVVSELEAAVGSDDIADVGRRINSFDALVGVHGAGLTNMVFLPRRATVVQVVPWGGLQWIARMDFGDPAEAMVLRYVQYEVAAGVPLHGGRNAAGAWQCCGQRVRLNTAVVPNPAAHDQVVDEINHGIDPTNERKMFQQLVRVSDNAQTLAKLCDAGSLKLRGLLEDGCQHCWALINRIFCLTTGGL